MPESNAGTTVFDASKHLAYSPPTRIVTMEDLGLERSPLTSFASSDPFPLLSYEAIEAHRRELFSPEVIGNCLHRTLPGAAMLRGMAQRYTPFIQSFWNSPEVLKIVSDIAGVDLIPAMNYEVCHTNIQLGPEGLDEDQSQGGVDINHDNPIVKWHKDSHPFVCVVMLSDARNMHGGETVLMGGNGKVMSIKAPQMVSRGRYISHFALPVTNMSERITIVTSFRPRDPTLVDDTTHANVRDVSHLTELYYQWTTYRLDNLAKRASILAEALRQKYAENVKQSDGRNLPGMCHVETVNYDEMKTWVEEQMKYLQQTIYEMRPLE
ncbi:hypothetical protein GQ53DRAFT_638505 [Thozetella sp. PMI_491]|nr:hypothetical protein GQ53DRAFT_638505 [Thozetella sp. PMI_491]